MSEPGKLKSAAEAVSNNVALAALTRIGVPLLLALVCYLATQVVSTDRRLALLEAQVGTQERRGAEDGRTVAQMRTDVASLVATQTATLRAVERLERLLEQRAGR